MEDIVGTCLTLITPFVYCLEDKGHNKFYSKKTEYQNNGKTSVGKWGKMSFDIPLLGM